MPISHYLIYLYNLIILDLVEIALTTLLFKGAESSMTSRNIVSKFLNEIVLTLHSVSPASKFSLKQLVLNLSVHNFTGFRFLECGFQVYKLVSFCEKIRYSCNYYSLVIKGTGWFSN